MAENSRVLVFDPKQRWESDNSVVASATARISLRLPIAL
jgi:hypothetical protein